MNIQIFGTKKCNDTKKAERFFKERGIKYQFIDMKEKGMSKGEFNSVAQANGGLENMVNWDGKDKDLLALIKYIADEDKPKWEDTITNQMLHWSYTPEQKEEVKKALAAGVPKATILTYFYPEVSVEKMSSYRKKH